jgi:hypothetical protein
MGIYNRIKEARLKAKEEFRKERLHKLRSNDSLIDREIIRRKDLELKEEEDYYKNKIELKNRETNLKSLREKAEGRNIIDKFTNLGKNLGSKKISGHHGKRLSPFGQSGNPFWKGVK